MKDLTKVLSVIRVRDVKNYVCMEMFRTLVKDPGKWKAISGIYYYTLLNRYNRREEKLARAGFLVGMMDLPIEFEDGHIVGNGTRTPYKDIDSVLPLIEQEAIGRGFDLDELYSIHNY